MVLAFFSPRDIKRLGYVFSFPAKKSLQHELLSMLLQDNMLNMRGAALVATLAIILGSSSCCNAFTSIAYTRCGSISSYSSALSVFGQQQQQQSSSAIKLSPLPKGISPFEKSLSKNIDIQGDFRKRAKAAIDAAIADNVKRLEVEFPLCWAALKVRVNLTILTIYKNSIRIKSGLCNWLLPSWATGSIKRAKFG